MILSQLAVLTVLAQAYNRTHVTDDPASQCLWWHENTVIEYHVNGDGNPETGPSVFTAVDVSFATWQAQFALCGSLSFQKMPVTTSRTVGYVEKKANENILLWRQSSCTDTLATTDKCWADDNCGNLHDCWQYSSSAIAITTTSYNPVAGQILDADVEFNTPAFVFTTVDSPVCVVGHWNTSCVATDVQNTLTHEIGHMVGLAHIGDASSTMNARADPGELSKRVLDPGTRQFVCDVYPKGGLAKNCKVVAYDGVLGTRGGCAAAPGALGLTALLGLLRRRRAAA